MHKQVTKYCNKIKKEFPNKFKNAKVVDMGSFDINGDTRFLFGPKCDYMGVDIRDGKNVDIICPCHEFLADDESFDVVISTEMLEHDPYWKKSLDKMVKLVKPNGILLITCASVGRNRHCINVTQLKDENKGHYKNITANDIADAIDLHSVFKMFRIDVLRDDIRFVGIKKNK